VSRGGEKLEGAFAAFALDVAGLDCLDVGASTGGFTDCMLQHGAARVIALDVGHAPAPRAIRRGSARDGHRSASTRASSRLRTSPTARISRRSDVSFISLKLILPRLAEVLLPGGQAVTLIKPQFEAGRAQAPRGVVRDPAVHEAVVEAIRSFGTQEVGLDWLGVVPSPLRGPEGNIEFLAWWRKGEPPA
jgi:23S rRNA (cytidine1920-2'-O)/16S rRNA (cytidine1409-2'-O)-methyltransferase